MYARYNDVGRCPHFVTSKAVRLAKEVTWNEMWLMYLYVAIFTTDVRKNARRTSCEVSINYI